MDTDDRDFSKMRTVEDLFWNAYAQCVRADTVPELLAIYRPIPLCRDLVAEAERREARRLRGAA
jgi:hypothetical protein